MNTAPEPQWWIKYEPGAWRKDLGLRMCGFAARGLWADLLTLMHEANPYGHLLINGHPPTAAQLANLLGGGASPADIEGWLEELGSNGVYSRTEGGVIYSRRMVRDRERQERNRAAGALGGNPALARKPNGADNSGDKHRANGPDNHPPGGADKRSDKRGDIPRARAKSQSQSQKNLSEDSSFRSPRARARKSSGASARRLPGAGPDTSDPKIRKQVWMHRITTELMKRVGSDRTVELAEAFERGDRKARKLFNQIDAELKAAKKKQGHSHGGS